MLNSRGFNGGNGRGNSFNCGSGNPLVGLLLLLGLVVVAILATRETERVFVIEAPVAKQVLAAIAGSANSRPVMSAGRAREGRTIKVVAVGAEHFEAIVTKRQLVTGDHHAQVRLWDENIHHAFGSIELPEVLLDRKHIATSVEGTSQITTCTETPDNHIVARLGEPAKDPLSNILGLFANVDISTLGVHGSLAHLRPNENVVAL